MTLACVRALMHRRALRGASVALVILALGVVHLASPAQTQPASASPGSRVNWQSGSWYLQGANVPWYNWGCDFGCGTSGGVSDPAVSSAVSNAFSQLNASGAHVVRWWVFPGDAHQITRDASGAPTGLDAGVYADFDAALRLAAQYDLYFDFVLFSGPTSIPTSWETNPNQRAQLANVLAPLFAHYSGNPRVLSWEVVNEPEFEIWNGHIAESDVKGMVQAVVNAVHANSTALATVGSAQLDGLPMWVGMGLDYYQAHWYDYMSSGNYCARCTDYPTVQARYNLDQPLVIGETYAGPDVDAYQRFVDFYNKAYAGTWAWSLFPNNTSDHLAIDLAAMRTFTGQHNDIGPRAQGTGVTATPTATRTSTPMPTRTTTPVPTATGTPPPVAGTTTVTFDDISNPNAPLSGQYPTGLIDWGNGAWFVSGPWRGFATNSISFNGSTLTSASFTFVSPRILQQVDVYNGGAGNTTVTLTCSGQPAVSRSLAASQQATLATGWTQTCSTVTFQSTNGWQTNFDNLVTSGGTSTSASATPTRTSGSPSTVTFDDLSNPNRPLSGQYPNGVIDWGNGAWFLSAPWEAFPTNSVSFNGGTLSRATFTFLSSHQLVQLEAYNGGSAPATVTLTCAGQPTVTATVPVSQRTTIQTGWAGSCASVTVASSNGWETNFDTLVIR